MFTYYYTFQKMMQYISASFATIKLASVHNSKVSLHDIRIENADCACFLMYYECSKDKLESETRLLYSALDKMDDIDLGDIVNAVVSTFQKSAQGEICILSDIDKIGFDIDGSARYPTSPKGRPFFYNTTKLKRRQMWRTSMERKIKFVNNCEPYQLRIFFECFCKGSNDGTYVIDSGRFDYTFPKQGMGYIP
jgi:hypothetical protein